MTDAKRDLVRAWLIKAEHDARSASKLAAGRDPCPDVAIFLCQQAAEKALKGFLVFHDQRFQKTHYLEALVKLATNVQPDFDAWLPAAARLTPYASRFRYPPRERGQSLTPTKTELRQALQDAQALCALVLARLPRAVHPAARAQARRKNRRK